MDDRCLELIAEYSIQNKLSFEQLLIKLQPRGRKGLLVLKESLLALGICEEHHANALDARGDLFDGIGHLDLNYFKYKIYTQYRNRL